MTNIYLASIIHQLSELLDTMSSYDGERNVAHRNPLEVLHVKTGENQASENLGNEDDTQNLESTDKRDPIIKPKIRHRLLKYAYEEDQWSPLNKNGKRIYDGEFLHELRNDPKSNIKPHNLPDLGVVLTYNINNTKKRIKAKKQNAVIVESLPDGENSSLKTTETVASRMFEQNSGKTSENDVTLEALFGELQQILAILMPDHLDVIITQFQMLDIDSYEKLQGLVDLIYEQALQKPSIAADYALMCKELAAIKVKGTEQEKSDVDFRKLIITRCVTEFEEAVTENAKILGRRKIELREQHFFGSYTKLEKKQRNRSFRLIRFMGELFKYGILTTFIMHKCLHYLLSQIDDKSLECFCNLLSSIGKYFESKGQDLHIYFKGIMDIVGNGPRFHPMLQDLIDLRNNKWIPKEDNSNSVVLVQNTRDMETKTLDGCEPLEVEVSNKLSKFESKNTFKPVDSPHLTSLGLSIDDHQSGNENTIQSPRNISLDIRNTTNPVKVITPKNEVPTEPEKSEKQSIPSVSKSLVTSPIKCNSPDSNPANTLSSKGSKQTSNVSKKRLAKKSATILDVYLTNPSMDSRLQNAASNICENFDKSTFPTFVRDALSKVVNKSDKARREVSLLITHLISTDVLPSNVYLSSLGEVLEASGDVVIDVTKIWSSFAEMIWYPLAQGTHQLSDLRTTMAPLKSKGYAGTLLGELLTVLVREKGCQWVKDKWNESGLQWSDFLQHDESVNDFIKKYKLTFIAENDSGHPTKLNGRLSIPEIYKQLLTLMSSSGEDTFNNTCSWISTNVGERASEPEFIKLLMIAILEVSNESYYGSWRFRIDKFQILQLLIPRYIDNSIKLSELQCLIAIQEYMYRLESPQRLLLEILEKQIYESILSFDVFHAWESDNAPKPLTAKSVAMFTVKSFFESLKDPNRSSNESVNDFIKKYKFEFILGDSNSSFDSLSGQLTMEQIHERLFSLMSNEKENSFDNVYSWIDANVGKRASEPQFMRILTTAILEVSIEPYNNTWKFNADKFQRLQPLIGRYLDCNLEVLELQCLIAIQEYIHKLKHPSGVLLQVIEKLWEDSVISTEAFLAWEKNKDPAFATGKSVAIMALTSFFTNLKEVDDESESESA